MTLSGYRIFAERISYKLQRRFLTQANWGSIHKHGVYFVRDVLERLNFLLIFFVLCGHLFTFENTPADPHLSEKEICSHARAQSPINKTLRIDSKFGYCCFYTKAFTEWKLPPSCPLSPIFQFLAQEIYQFLLAIFWIFWAHTIEHQLHRNREFYLFCFLIYLQPFSMVSGT